MKDWVFRAGVTNRSVSLIADSWVWCFILLSLPNSVSYLNCDLKWDNESYSCKCNSVLKFKMTSYFDVSMTRHTLMFHTELPHVPKVKRGETPASWRDLVTYFSSHNSQQLFPHTILILQYKNHWLELEMPISSNLLCMLAVLSLICDFSQFFLSSCIFLVGPTCVIFFIRFD